MRRIRLLLAGLLLAGALVGSIAAEPASAHQASTQSYVVCAAHRMNSDALILHSVPVYMDTSTVIYWCKESNGVETWAYNVWVSVSNPSEQFATNYTLCPGYNFCNEPS